MIIDFHTHVFPPEVAAHRAGYAAMDAWFAECYGNPKARMVDGPTLVASMDQAGIDKSVVCGFPWRDHGLRSFHNDYLIDVVRAFPDRLIGFAVAGPTEPAGAAAELERCISKGLRGVGELNADAQGFDLEDCASLEPFVAALIELDVPLLLHSSEPVGHVYPGKGKADPKALYRFVSCFPDLKVVLAHWGGGLPFYELMPEVAVAARNVFYDTSASLLLYQPRVFNVALELVGPHKILFGTDYPLLRQERFLAKVRSLGLPQPALADILGDNAARLLKYG